MAVQDEFPKLFQGLGSMGEEYKIHLKDNVKPHALCTARNVPLPLHTKVQEELKRMQSLGVILPVNEPSPWCAGMVVVPKPSGDVRICVDLKPLNEGVLREFHPLPKIEDISSIIRGNCLQQAGRQPELFQKRMNAILSGQKGVLCWMDDVLVFGRN